jgi:hypothetical protein
MITLYHQFLYPKRERKSPFGVIGSALILRLFTVEERSARLDQGPVETAKIAVGVIYPTEACRVAFAFSAPERTGFASALAEAFGL